MTASVTSAGKPQKTRGIRKAMLRQRTEKNEWLESPAHRPLGQVKIMRSQRKPGITGRTAASKSQAESQDWAVCEDGPEI